MSRAIGSAHLLTAYLVIAIAVNGGALKIRVGCDGSSQHDRGAHVKVKLYF